MLYTWNSSQPVEKIPRKKLKVPGGRREEERAVVKRKKKRNFTRPPLDSNLETIFFIILCCFDGYS